MYEGKPSALFARYAVPQMVGLLFNSIYMIVDGVFIGRRLGTASMAAAAVSVPLIEILIALSMALASGAGVLISGHLGRGERENAVRVFNNAFYGALGMGALVMILGNAFIYSLATALGSTLEIHREAVEYMRYIVTFSPFLILSFLLGALARNDGRPRLAMVALATGSISNIVLDYVFMYPLNMGIGGAALATAIGPVFSVLILLPHFLRRRGALAFARTHPQTRLLGRVYVLGFPSFIMEFTIGIITFIYNSAIVRHGYAETGLAAYLLIGYLMLIILTIFLGMAEGLQPVFSYFSGTGEQARSRALLRFSTAVFLAVGAASYGLIAVFSGKFFAIFNPGDAELIAFAQRRSLPYFCGFFLAGYNILMISYWQSTLKTRSALAVSLCRSLVWPLALMAALPAMFGRESIWACHSASEALTAACAFALPRMRRRARGQ